MTKEGYIKEANNLLKGDKAKKIMINQINNFYEIKDNFTLKKHNYKTGDNVFLKKGTLLHGTYKNIEGLREIVKNGLISSFFIDGRYSKYPSSVGVWKLKKDYFLKDYINFYSGGTIMFDNYAGKKTTKVISYSNLPNIIDIITFKDDYHKWYLEQTKEARFMPSLVQNKVQIGIIFDGQSKEIKTLLDDDILNNINDIDVKEFVNPKYYEQFIIDRKSKNDFFTDRESAILFGIPSCFIEGILVGRIYEQDEKILNEIKALLPNAYICNLNGKVIKI